MVKRFCFFCAIVCIGLFKCAQAQVNTDSIIDTGNKFSKSKFELQESPAVVSKRLAWWSDARFGFFIHWGLYSQDGCFYHGEDGRSEHMMRNLQIPISEYKQIAKEFNPVKFNADEWAKLAKDAGMKYMVITSKHHDGFAMFNSPSNDYNIVKQTSWGRDPFAELKKACKKQGIKFGVYYSLGRDWHHPQCNSIGGRRSNTWDFPNEKEKDYSIYFNEKVKPQITELMKQYRPAIIWFDTPELITKAESSELLHLIHSINPMCIVNQRVGNGMGDYAVKEQKVPKEGEPQPWETCMTMNGAWGYHKTDHKWKSSEILIQNLVDIASKGGNLLLNVGPTGEGIFPAPSVAILKEVGEWLKINGAAVYGTKSSPVGKLPWGCCTKKVNKKTTTLFLTVFNWPKNGELYVPQIKNKVIKAEILTNGKHVKANSSDEGLKIELPKDAPDKIASVIKIKLNGFLK